MIKVGVIAEYNPFHNGHLYHLNQIKRKFPNCILILILIGNFTQRGDVSVINKWDKTKIALSYGYDLVVELPFNLATSSANIYAKGAIDLLNYLDCNYLIFGSETNNVDLFKKIANITENNQSYNDKIKSYLKKGFKYPKACSLALEDISNIIIDKPNDVLALEYVRNIINTKSKIIPISIKRENNYHSQDTNNSIVSATAIRKNLDDIEKIKNTLPEVSLEKIKKISLNDYFKYIKYEIISNDNLNKILDVDEGIENKLKKEIEKANDVDDLIMKVKSKRYSYNKVKRMILHILTKTEKNYDKEIKYIRVLGLSDKGKIVLKEIKKKIDIPVITKFKKEYESLFKDDFKAAKIYSLIADYDIKNEFKSSIKKD